MIIWFQGLQISRMIPTCLQRLYFLVCSLAKKIVKILLYAIAPNITIEYIHLNDSFIPTKLYYYVCYKRTKEKYNIVVQNIMHNFTLLFTIFFIL